MDLSPVERLSPFQGALHLRQLHLGDGAHRAQRHLPGRQWGTSGGTGTVLYITVIYYSVQYITVL